MKKNPKFQGPMTNQTPKPKILKAKIAIPEYLKVAVSSALIAQAVHTLEKRSRVRTAHTKIRSEVRGGGKKPWKQKGTGRARHASIRSPIWVGGGRVFGPRARKERVVALPSRMRQRALAGALGFHMRQKSLEFVKVTGEATKTKEVAGIFSEPGLLVVSESHQALVRGVRNLRRLSAATASQVTIQDVVQANRVWVDEEALPALAKRCGA